MIRWRLEPFFPRSVGFGPVFSPPKSARVEQLSITAADQSISSIPPRSSVRLYEEEILLQESLGEEERQARAIAAAGAGYSYLEDCDRALEYFERAPAIQERLGNPGALGVLENYIAMVKFLTGDMVAARRGFETSLAISKECDALLQMKIALGNLAIVDVCEGNARSARERLRECLEGLRIGLGSPTTCLRWPRRCGLMVTLPPPPIFSALPTSCSWTWALDWRSWRVTSMQGSARPSAPSSVMPASKRRGMRVSRWDGRRRRW